MNYNSNSEMSNLRNFCQPKREWQVYFSRTVEVVLKAESRPALSDILVTDWKRIIDTKVYVIVHSKRV